MSDSIDDALQMSDADLYISIGEALEGGRAAPQDAHQREGIGQRYFASLTPRIRTIVCNESLVRLLDKSGPEKDLAGAILDLLRPHIDALSGGVPLFTIAVLTARCYAEICRPAP